MLDLFAPSASPAAAQMHYVRQEENGKEARWLA
jgi:hypothetical protein